MAEHVIEIDEDGKVHGNDLQSEIARALNGFSAENGSNTPDFILAQYLLSCLAAFNEASRARETWYGTELRIGGGSVRSPVTGEALDGETTTNQTAKADHEQP